MSVSPDTLERTIDRLDARLPGRVRRAAPSGEFTTYRVGGPFAAVVLVGDDAALDALAGVVASVDVPCSSSGGARTSSSPTAGSPASPSCSATSSSGSSSIPTPLRSSPAVRRRCPCSRAGPRPPESPGLEFYVGIPGSVGGAVRMNAGGHGRETREVLVDVDLLDLRTGALAARGR